MLDTYLLPEDHLRLVCTASPGCARVAVSDAGELPPGWSVECLAGAFRVACPDCTRWARIGPVAQDEARRSAILNWLTERFLARPAAL